jgi:hypothetical protein
MGAIARILLIVGGVIASWFVTRDDLNFSIVAMIATLFVVVGLVALIAFREQIAAGLRHVFGKDDEPPRQ